MKPRRKPLKRTPLARGDKPIERKTELKRTWWKRAPREPKTKAVKKPAPNGPTKARIESSEIPKAIRDAVLDRDQFSCVRCGRYLVDTIRYGLQHRRPRGVGGSRLLHTMANLVTLCGWTVDAGTCTERVELLNRKTAAAEGWLVPNGVTPEEWPVRRWTPDGPRWMQPGVEWVPASPHPRQTEEAVA